MPLQDASDIVLAAELIWLVARVIWCVEYFRIIFVGCCFIETIEFVTFVAAIVKTIAPEFGWQAFAIVTGLCIELSAMKVWTTVLQLIASICAIFLSVTSPVVWNASAIRSALELHSSWTTAATYLASLCRGAVGFIASIVAV